MTTLVPKQQETRLLQTVHLPQDIALLKLCNRWNDLDHHSRSPETMLFNRADNNSYQRPAI